ncbi:hypothetical protein OAK64_01225 [Deltaproteobacteria bacterium]|nr:hypothetical protein [Deltaproteobacteria bacterium]
MKKFLVIIIFFILNFNWGGQNQNYAKESQEFESVLKLIRQGWEINKKQSEVVILPGLKSYQSLKREVLVVKYRLRKGTEFIYCLVEYDSQLDTISEVCEASEQKAGKPLGGQISN